MRYFLLSENETALTGLRLAGVEGQRVTNAAEAETAVKQIRAQEDIAVLLMTPEVAAMIPGTVGEMKLAGRRPLLTVIPSPEDGGGVELMDMIRQAIGVKL